MPYLAKDDYTLRISVLHLEEILAQAAEASGLTADNVLSNAESWAQAMVKSYLTSQYDIGGEYAKVSPDPRDFLIMQVTIDLSLCTLHKTINPRDMPEHIANACTAAVEWLQSARDELILVGLPPPPVDPLNPDAGTAANRTHLKSQQKFISKPHTDLSLFDT